MSPSTRELLGNQLRSISEEREYLVQTIAEQESRLAEGRTRLDDLNRRFDEIRTDLANAGGQPTPAL